MAEQKVGKGSPEGKRWFICKFGEMSFTLSPEHWDKDVNGFAFHRKGEHISFTREIKPRKLRGTGEPGLNNPNNDGTDKNDSLYWGIYSTEKPKEIEFFRNHAYYRKTVQDNRLDFNMWLKELDWDPGAVHTDRSSGLVDRRGFSIGKDDEFSIIPPEDAAPSISKVKPGLKKVAA